MGHLSPSGCEVPFRMMSTPAHTVPESSDRALDLETIAALDAATQAITEVLDLETVLQLIVDRVSGLVGARYAALGISDATGRLQRFITSGLTPEERLAIGPEPVGHGLLALIIQEGRTLRVADIPNHPRAHGFPPNHPPMKTLLGVPIEIGGRLIGDLYLTDKRGTAEFTEADERIVELFARHAGIAIEHARLHERLAALRVVAERERIGRDLHDGVIQGLYAVGLTLEEAAEIIPAEPDRAVSLVDSSIDSIHRSIAEIREFIGGLRPSMAGASVATGIEALADGLRLTTPIDVEASVDLSPTELNRLPAQARHELLHIVREALSNIARHSRATRAVVLLAPSDDGLRLEVADNGVGFDPASVASGRHHGLVNLRDRAASAGARLEIDSRPGEGTRLILHVPTAAEGSPS
jgi:signal transduction histidine kinase